MTQIDRPITRDDLIAEAEGYCRSLTPDQQAVFLKGMYFSLAINMLQLAKRHGVSVRMPKGAR